MRWGEEPKPVPKFLPRAVAASRRLKKILTADLTDFTDRKNESVSCAKSAIKLRLASVGEYFSKILRGDKVCGRRDMFCQPIQHEKKTGVV
jgi:hypothetical protein